MSNEHSNYNSKEILGEKYEIQRQLASKGGRKTLLARDFTNEKLVVIKLLTFGNDMTWEDLKLFEREAETLKLISHNSIPSYIDYFELDLEHSKVFALVQAYIDALSIEEQVQAGRSFSEAEVKELAMAILNILDYLHARQPSIIHRDIKPSNILLGERSGNSVGNIYLVDFGSVQNLATKKSGTITVVGTYGYMPPEQFGGRAKSSSDLYSLGATLIYIITGQHPADLPENDLKIEFEQLVNISPGLINWLKKMTEPSLSKRYKTAKEALQELEECNLYNEQNFQQKKAPTQNINQPSKSQVLLRKNDKEIQVNIPPVGLFSITTCANLLIFSVITLFIPVLPRFFMDTSHNQAALENMGIDYLVWFLKLIGQVFTLGIIVAITFFLIRVCLGVFGLMKLRINSQRIFLIYELFGVKRHSPMPSLRKDIYRLEKISQSNGKSYLIIWAKKQKYQIAKNSHFTLTSSEIYWLAQELSRWLDLPIIEREEHKKSILL